jgi:hypothetical protein
MKTDRIRTDITDIIFVFIFLVELISTISDKIGLDVDIINIRFKYSNTDTESDIEYSDSNMDRSKPL